MDGKLCVEVLQARGLSSSVARRISSTQIIHFDMNRCACCCLPIKSLLYHCITTICSSTAAAPDKTWTSINHHTLESKIKTEHTSAGSILQIWKCYKDSSKTSSHIGSPWLSQNSRISLRDVMHLKKSQELRTEEYRLFDLTSSLLGCRRIRPYVTCKVHWGTQVQTSTGWCSRDVVM